MKFEVQVQGQGWGQRIRVRVGVSLVWSYGYGCRVWWRTSGWVVEACFVLRFASWIRARVRVRLRLRLRLRVRLSMYCLCLILIVVLRSIMLQRLFLCVPIVALAVSGEGPNTCSLPKQTGYEG